MIWTVHFAYDNVGWPSFERAAQMINDTGKLIVTHLSWNLFHVIRSSLILIQLSTIFCPLTSINRPFPSYVMPLCQKESSCKTFLVKISFICTKMNLYTELIFIWKVSHEDSIWHRDKRQLGNGRFKISVTPDYWCLHISPGFFLQNWVWISVLV